MSIALKKLEKCPVEPSRPEILERSGVLFGVVPLHFLETPACPLAVPHHFLVKKFLPLENEQIYNQHSLEAAGVRNPHFLNDSLKSGLNDPSVLISRGIPNYGAD